MSGPIFIDCVALDNGGDGFHFGEGANAQVIGGYSAGNKGHGYYIAATANVRMDRPFAVRNGKDGLHVAGDGSNGVASVTGSAVRKTRKRIDKLKNYPLTPIRFL